MSLLAKAFPFFPSDLLQAIANTGEPREFREGEIIVQQGKPFYRTHIILRGCVKASRQSDDGSEFVITYLAGGDSFAVSVSEDSADTVKRSILTFQAIEPTFLVAITFNEKDSLAHQYDQWYKYLLRTAVKYYASYQELVDNIAFKKMDHRIEYFLRRLSKTKDQRLLQISHQEIADGLNSSREVVSRLLKKMQESGKIRMMHNSIELLEVV